MVETKGWADSGTRSDIARRLVQTSVKRLQGRSDVRTSPAVEISLELLDNDWDFRLSQRCERESVLGGVHHYGVAFGKLALQQSL